LFSFFGYDFGVALFQSDLPDSSYLECATFVGGVASGHTVMHLWDGTRIIGDSMDGLIEGNVKEIDADGKTLYEGQYR
jgi:hypothetical protein